MYAKIFASLYQGTLRGRSHEILVFTNLLAHCDADGNVDIHFRAIAEETGLKTDEVRRAVLNLEAPDEESRSPDEEGRRIIRLDEHRAWGWAVVNYKKYRDIKSDDDRRERNRRAVARHRERKRLAQGKAPQSDVIGGNSRSPLSPQGEGEGEGEGEKKEEAANAASGPEKAKCNREPPFDPLAFPLPHGERFKAAWLEWCEERRTAKKPITARAAKLQLEKLGRFTEGEACDAIAVSIASGWSGIFPRSSGGNPRGKDPGFTPEGSIPAGKYKRPGPGDSDGGHLPGSQAGPLQAPTQQVPPV